MTQLASRLLRYQHLGNSSAAEESERLLALANILQTLPHIMKILTCIRDESLPDAWLVSGGIYQTVWNVMTDRPPMHGIKDYDVIYYDGTDLSYEGEDTVIKRVNAALPDLADLLEVRNQARVHLWYQKRFGRPYRPLDCSMDSLTTYASRTHAVAARLNVNDELIIHAPFGLANLFGMRLVPNYTQENSETYTEKSARMKSLWPELELVPWSETST